MSEIVNNLKQEKDVPLHSDENEEEEARPRMTEGAASEFQEPTILAFIFEALKHENTSSSSSTELQIDSYNNFIQCLPSILEAEGKIIFDGELTKDKTGIKTWMIELKWSSLNKYFEPNFYDKDHRVK